MRNMVIIGVGCEFLSYFFSVWFSDDKDMSTVPVRCWGSRARRLRKLKIKQGQGHRGSGKEREGNLQPVLLILRLERRQ